MNEIIYAHVRLENTNQGHNKFWVATVEGKKAWINWGKIGTSGMPDDVIKEFPSNREARIFLIEKQIEKLKKGYKEVLYEENPISKPQRLKA